MLAVGHGMGPLAESYWTENLEWDSELRIHALYRFGWWQLGTANGRLIV